MSFTAAEIATHLDGEVIGNQQVVLHGFAPADRAQAGDLTFAENEEYLALAGQSAASAIIAGGKTTLTGKTLIRVKHPRVAFAKALTLFFPEPKLPAGIHPTAVIAPTVQVDATAHVGPHCVLGENVFIGPRVALRGGNHVGDGCRVEADTVLFPNVTLYPNTQIGQRVRIHAGSVIGSDGFGYAQTEGIHLKVPQIGHVIVGDDVEIGACTTVDRGALGPTVIGKGTKIDNLVQIGHNVQVGEYCLIISQAGVAGSSKLGNYVILAGQVGVAGHLEIGDRAILGAQAGVGTNVPPGVTWMGSFAQPAMDFKRQQVGLRELPQLLRRVAELEKLAGIKKGRDKTAAAPEA